MDTYSEFSYHSGDPQETLDAMSWPIPNKFWWNCQRYLVIFTWYLSPRVSINGPTNNYCAACYQVLLFTRRLFIVAHLCSWAICKSSWLLYIYIYIDGWWLHGLPTLVRVFTVCFRDRRYEDWTSNLQGDKSNASEAPGNLAWQWNTAFKIVCFMLFFSETPWNTPISICKLTGKIWKVILQGFVDFLKTTGMTISVSVGVWYWHDLVWNWARLLLTRHKGLLDKITGIHQAILVVKSSMEIDWR